MTRRSKAAVNRQTNAMIRANGVRTATAIMRTRASRLKWSALLASFAMLLATGSTIFSALAAPGSAWTPLTGGGVNGVDSSIYALVTDSSGNIYAGGNFTQAGNTPNTNYIAMWNGSDWQAIGPGLADPVSSIAASSPTNVYASTEVGRGYDNYDIWHWDGSNWTRIKVGEDNDDEYVNSMVLDTFGNLYVAGSLEMTLGSGIAQNIAKWDGTAWSALDNGANNSINELVIDSVGNIYAGGYFTNTSGTPVNRVAKWDGTAWSAVGLGLDGPVWTLALDSSGNLYAGGEFHNSGDLGTPIDGVAMWNGSTWSALSSGINPDTSNVSALTVDSSGNLYVGGKFTQAGGVTAKNVAQWNGSTWSALDAGLELVGTEMNDVWALVSITDDIYAGGTFTTSASTTVNRIAAWTSAAPTPPYGSVNFITEWTTSSPSETITLPVYSGGTYNFTVNWGDGSATEDITSVSAPVTHTYATAGAHTVTITGTLNGWDFTSVPASRGLLTDVLQWGDVQLGNNGGYFNQASNFDISATDAPDLSGTTNLSSTFNGATSLTAPDFSGWDTSLVTDFRNMFIGATSLTTPNLSTWDTSAGTNFSYMFANATLFNGDIGYWDVSSGATHEGMFQQANAFNGTIGYWDLAATASVKNMMKDATSFNQDLSSWQYCATSSTQYMDFSTGANSTWTSASPTKLPTFRTGCGPVTFTNALPSSRLVIDYVTPNGQNRSYTWVGSPDTPTGNLPSPAKSSMTFTGWFSRQSLINGTTASAVGTAGSDEVFAGLIPSELAQVLATLP